MISSRSGARVRVDAASGAVELAGDAAAVAAARALLDRQMASYAASGALWAEGVFKTLDDVSGFRDHRVPGRRMAGFAASRCGRRPIDAPPPARLKSP
jgi:hypothetical protein